MFISMRTGSSYSWLGPGALQLHACFGVSVRQDLHLDAKFLSGWPQGLTNMCVGEKRKLKIPPSLGYGKYNSILRLTLCLQNFILHTIQTKAHAERRGGA